jgi:glucosamine--fructose-6-phosphate aminotransferase (isomerizing)
MCGIFGVTNDSQHVAAETVLNGLKKLEYRGYDSWGIALIDGRSIRIEKHIGKIGTAETSLPPGITAIGHTRWATHGGVTDINAHPHNDCSGTVSVIHNGIVENFQSLKSQLMAQGHVFVSETDTEVIAHLIEEHKKTKSLAQATLATFKTLHGSNAIAVLDAETSTIMVCRNGSPLVVGYGKDSAYLASDVTALLPITKQVHFLLDGEAAILHKARITIVDIESEQEKTTAPETIDWEAEQAEKGGFPHFMIKEIYEQKKTILNAFTKNDDALAHIVTLIKDGMQPLFLGCGSAYYCGLAATYFFADARVESRVYGAYELDPFVPFLNKKSLVFAISQSGETADTLIAVKQAKKAGATVVALVNARGTTLERLADYTVPVLAGPEISVVSTKAFTAQLATLLRISLLVSGKEFTHFPEQFSEWIESPTLKERALSLAKQLVDEEHIYVIGKHINYPSTFEFALKMKETSYIHAEAFSSGELKHGVISLIQKDTPCVVLTANDGIYAEVISSAIELKSRGGFIVGIGPKNNSAFDVWIETPSEDPLLSPFYNIVVGQLLGYFLSIGRGADPDKPRNLAKSVTVK